MYQTYSLSLNQNVIKKLVRSGKLGIHYNKGNFIKKYEVGYWDTLLDVNSKTEDPVSGPYQVFRPVYSSSKFEKAQRKFDKMTQLALS